MCRLYHRISAWVFYKANETILSMKSKFQTKATHKILKCMKSTRNYKFLVSDCVPVCWNKSYNRFCSYHLQDKLDKWEEITSYFPLLACNGALNISGFGCCLLTDQDIRLLLKKCPVNRSLVQICVIVLEHGMSFLYFLGIRI